MACFRRIHIVERRALDVFDASVFHGEQPLISSKRWKH
jgi:hypothetical protein